MKSRAPSGVDLIRIGRLDLDEAVLVVDVADRLDQLASAGAAARCIGSRRMSR